MTKANLGLYCLPFSCLLGATYDNILATDANQWHAGLVLVLAACGCFHLIGLLFGFTFEK